jgi:hypothetical protein
MQCNSCGNQLAPGAAFCGQCGQSANSTQVGGGSTPQSSYQAGSAGPVQASPVYQQIPSQQPQWAAAPTTSGKAIASLILALFGISLFAVIFGHIARKEIRNSRGQIGGDGLALAGLIVGWIGLAAYAIVVFFVFVAAAMYSF